MMYGASCSIPEATLLLRAHAAAGQRSMLISAMKHMMADTLAPDVVYATAAAVAAATTIS